MGVLHADKHLLALSAPLHTAAVPDVSDPAVPAVPAVSAATPAVSPADRHLGWRA